MADSAIRNPQSAIAAGEAVAPPPPRPRVVHRAALVVAAGAMMAGIVAGRHVPLPLGVWGAVAAAGLAAAAATLGREHLSAVCAGGIIAAIVGASAAAYVLTEARVGPDHIVNFSGDGTTLATVRGRIASIPQTEPPALHWRTAQTKFLLAAEAIRLSTGEWAPTEGLVRVTVGESANCPPAGSRVELIGSLSRPRGPGNPGQYDWRAGDRARGIHVRFFVPAAAGVIPAPAGRAGWARQAWWRVRELARQHLAAPGGPDGQLLEALVLGERGPALRELNRTMIDAGTAHLLSISGMHLGILLGLVYWLLRLTSLTPRRSAIVVLLVLAAYVPLAEPRAPLLRAALMAAAMCAGAIAGRKVVAANALAAAAVVLLVVDPRQLFDAGFQLSFAIVAGLLVLQAPLRQAIFGRWLARRGLMVFRDDQRLRRWLHYAAANANISLACISLSAYLAGVPLVACHFGLFSPYAPLLTVLLLPLIIAVVVPAYVSVVLAWAMPNLAAAVADGAARVAGATRTIVNLTSHLPGLSLELLPIPAALAAGFYAVIGLWLWARGRRRGRRAAAAATALLAAATALTQLPARPPAAAEMHVLNVGSATMMLLHTPAGRTCLFDAGSLTSADAYDQVLRPFLRARRLPAPDAAFISHANIDHYSAIAPLLKRHRLRTVYVSEFFGREDSPTPELRHLLDALADRHVEVVRLKAGDTVDLPGGVRVDVLWPPAQAAASRLNVNDASLVLRASCGGRSVLTTGDIGQVPQENLARPPHGRIAADALILPHHGAGTPALEGFVKAVNPQVLVRSGAFRIPSADFLQAVAGRTVYATFNSGWIRLRLTGRGVEVETMRPGNGSE